LTPGVGPDIYQTFVQLLRCFMAPSAKRARPDRILDAAEDVFGEFGFAGASMRHIVQRARVNLATVYYYFGSKEGLMEAVLKRRFAPLRAEQLALLKQFRRKARAGALAVEKILEAMLLPPLRLAMGAPAEQRAVARLVGRIITEPNPRTQTFLRRQHAEVRKAFLEAMQASLPELPTPDLQLRLELVWGALGFILCKPQKLVEASLRAHKKLAAERTAAETVRFFAAGFQAVPETR
jgi:AcrR family transcriptional regulator